MSAQTLSDLSRRFDNLLVLGTIAQVDHAGARVMLDLAGRRTGWLPYPCEIGANFRRWRPLRPGTQVLAACPSGDPANAVIVQILYTDALPPPAALGHVDLIQYDDGTVIRHDSQARRTEILCPGGTLVLDATNVVLRTGEDGYFHLDHAGKAARLTHKGGNLFEAETWEAGAVVTGLPDHGFQPFRVASPGEAG